MASELGNSFVLADGPSALRAPECPRVVVVSGFRLLREGVASLLAHQSSIQVVGTVDLSALPCEIAELAPDMLLVDVSVHGALELCGPIRGAIPDVKIVALGVAEHEDVVFACAKAGISGFVAPDGSARDIVATVHSAGRGELVCSPRTAGILLSRVSKLASQPSVDHDTLTDREKNILLLMDEGMSNKAIAASLRIRNATVKNHVHSILSKLRVRSRIEAVAHMRRGLVRGLENFKMSRAPTGFGAITYERQSLDQTI